MLRTSRASSPTMLLFLSNPLASPRYLLFAHGAAPQTPANRAGWAALPVSAVAALSFANYTCLLALRLAGSSPHAYWHAHSALKQPEKKAAVRGAQAARAAAPRAAGRRIPLLYILRLIEVVCADFWDLVSMIPDHWGSVLIFCSQSCGRE